MKICSTCQNIYPDDFTLCPRDGARLAAQATATEAQLAAGLSRRFRIVRRLGAGGMGAVFLAEQITVGNRPVALKVLNRKLLDDPDFLLRFQNEAASTGRIRHSNVVTIYESGQADDGTPYIAMEFLEGESLRETLKRRGALPVPEVAEILQQAARGLNAAHRLGIIHRDLKPDNIFLTRGDENERMVKVVDFGIAKLRESGTHTQTGMVLGTPAYMSYEQASGMRSDELDARSDVYSLGIVTYEMLTGRVPFHSDTPLGYVRKHMMEEPPPFHAVAPALAIPLAVEGAVMKALVKDRNQRYASVLDLARALAAAAQPPPAAEFSLPLPSTKIVPPPAAREPAAPMLRSASAPTPADVAVQTPPPTPVERVVETPRPQPIRNELAPATSRPTAIPEPPQFRTLSEPSSKMKYVAIVAVVVILIVAGVWYFSRQRKGPESAGPSQAQATAPLIAPVHVEQWQELNPQGYVNDFANVLNTTTVQGLTRLSAEVDQKAKVQIAVVTIKTLEGDNVEDFANHLFNKWGVGYKGTDRGVMVLLATDDHKYRTEVGYGLERILSNDKVGGFGLDMVPLLRRGDYDGAIDQIVGQIAQVIAQDSHISLDSLANFHPVTHATTLGVTTDRRNQIEAAKRQGDNYYDNGEYDKAINAYQVGLKLAPTNAPLLQALRRAQTAKAAEVKFNQ